MILNSHTARALALALAVTGQTSVVAQETFPKGAASDLMEEVIVQGTKRSADIVAQKVPTQIAVFGKTQLDARQVLNLTDLSMATANVSLDDIGTAPGIANFSIRGQGLNSSIPSIDPTVGVFVNGVYLGLTMGLITDMFDVEAVEIHKGPQGVLFGRNVTGGAVLLRTARPGEEFKVTGRVAFESGLQSTLSGTVEGGLSDMVNAKLAVHFRDDNGYYHNPTVGRKVGENQSYMLRSTVVVTPSDMFNTTLITEMGSSEGDSSVIQNSAGYTGAKPSTKGETVSDHPGLIDLEWSQTTWESELDLDQYGSLTNIFGYRTVNQSSATDIDGSALNIFHATMGMTFDQISNELRYNGNLMDQWEVTSGLYYYQADMDYFESRSLFADFESLGIPQPNVQLGGGGQQDHRTYGLFLNNYYELPSNVTLQAGIRYSDEKKDVSINPTGTCTYDAQCTPGNEGTSKANFWSGKLGAQWQATADIMTYTHWARSYRAGGFNFRTPLAEPKAFKPERVDSFEAGVKSSLLDNSLRLNAAAFLNKVHNLQREVNIPSETGGIFQDIDNTGNADIIGLEAEALYMVTPSLVLNASVGYLDGDYKKLSRSLVNDPANPDDDLIIDDADYALRLPRLSKWTFNTGVTYDYALQWGMLTARADYAYRSSAAYSDNNFAIFNPYHMVNMSLGFEPNEGNWSVTIYGKNLTDEVVLGGLTLLPFGDLGSNYLAPMAKGRRWGAELRVTF